jgi:hypothetical protein
MVGTCGIYASGSGLGLVAGFCEHGNEPSGSIKDGEFPDCLERLLVSQEGTCSMGLVS